MMRYEGIAALEGLSPTDSPLAPILLQRMGEIRLKLLELAEQHQRISVMVNLYKEELAKLPKIPKTLLSNYKPKAFSPLGRPTKGEVRACLLCGSIRYIKRSVIENILY